MSDFLKHVMVMLSGAVFAQLIPMLISPVLTRLYSPAQFGVFSSVVALAGILSVIVTLRFDLAVVLPKERKEAANLVGLAAGSAIILSVVLWGVGFAISLVWPDLSMLQSLGVWWQAVPLLTLLIALQQTIMFFANREKQYRTIATGNILLQLVVAFVAIGVGLMASPMSWLNGLVVARLLGFVVCVATIYQLMRNFWKEYRHLIEPLSLRATAVTYRRFPFFNVPYSLAGVFSREFLVLALTSVSQLIAAGHYGFARLILNAPINFLTAALSQVFYREAAANVGSAVFRKFILRLMVLFAFGLAPLFALGACWSQFIFVRVFGSEWEESGRFVAMLMPIALLSIFTSWPERLFEVRGRQRLALTIQLAFDATSVVGVMLLLLNGHSATQAIGFYIVVQFAYQLCYLFAIFELAELLKRQYFLLLSILFVGSGGITVMHIVLGYFYSLNYYRLLLEAILAITMAIGSSYYVNKHFNEHFWSNE